MRKTASLDKWIILLRFILVICVIAAFGWIGLQCFFGISVSDSKKEGKWQEGDIVFQMSKSKQSPLIALATGSPYTHCGIVVEKSGQFYVLEAINTVSLTPIDKWIKRGRFKQCKSRRVLKTAKKIRYKKYLGKRYDLQFSFNNDKYYCSELVWLIYKEQFGIELCKPKKVSEYNIAKMVNVMRKRGISKNQFVVAPCDLLE